MEDINLSLFSVLSILSLFAVLLFVVVINFSQENKGNAKKVFSYYLLNISFVIFFFLIYDVGLEEVAFILIPFLTVSVLLIAPMLWIYIQKIVDVKVNIRNHLFLPIGVGIISIVLMILAATVKSSSLNGYFKQALTYLISVALTVGFLVQNTIYIVKSIKLYQLHLKRVEQEFSYTEDVDLKWFKWLIYGYLIFVVGLVISNLFHDLWSDIFYTLIMLFYVVFAGYNGMKQEAVKNVKEDVSYKSEKSELETSDFFKELKINLINLMEEEKLYLDQALTIHVLSKKLLTNSKYLSQLINSEFNKSFVVFINEYRVNEAKELLLNHDNDNLTIEAIGNQAGFKSKSSFNSAFKKFTGQTPSMFLKMN